MEKEVKYVMGKLMFGAMILALIVLTMVYLNSRWKKIRDIRRAADAKSITKALKLYNLQFNQFPDNIDDDGDGWDNSNDNNNFLHQLVEKKLLPGHIFDPKNNEEYYYRYQKFNAGDYGCLRPFVIFQVINFETEGMEHGSGECPDMDFSAELENGYTWYGDGTSG